MSYVIYDEDGEKMRVVGRLEEAKKLIENKLNWTYKFFRTPKPVFKFEDALI